MMLPNACVVLSLVVLQLHGFDCYSSSSYLVNSGRMNPWTYRRSEALSAEQIISPFDSAANRAAGHIDNDDDDDDDDDDWEVS